MKIMRLLLPLYFISLTAFSQTAIDGFVRSPMMENANVSILVRDASSGKIIYESRSGNVTIPASTIKLVTTATALEMFGPDFRFETKLDIDGRIDKDSTLNGNIYIRGGGDPTLGSEKLGEKFFLPKWVTAVKSAGIKKINGRIIADNSYFEQQVINPKWTWEDMGNYYAPAIHGISYLDNTFRLIFRSGKIGTTPQILRTEPEMPGLNVDNQVKSTSIGFDNAYFYGAPNSNERSIYGEIPANREEFVVKGDIVQPGLLLAQHFNKILSENGIMVQESPVLQAYTTGVKKTIYTYVSPPLRDIITEINVKSNNHFAEYVFKLIGTKHSNNGNTKQAIDNICTYWKSKGLPIEQLYQVDGCGLSPTNAVSANFMVELLLYMKNKSKYANEFYNSLPVTGGRGTLSTMLVNTPLHGKVRAKSGTIENVKAYAGYMELNNRTLVFALLVNYARGSSKSVTARIEEFLLQLSEVNP